MQTKRIEKIVTVTQLANCLGISKRRVQQLSKVGIIPKRSRGEYELFECLQSYLKFLRRLLRRYMASYKKCQEQCLKKKTNFPNLPFWEDVIGNVPDFGTFHIEPRDYLHLTRRKRCSKPKRLEKQTFFLESTGFQVLERTTCSHKKA